MERWQVYVQEALTQIGFAKQCYRSYRRAKARGDISGIFLHIHHFVVHSSNIDKLLDPKPGSNRDAILKGHIDLNGINLKPFRKLRNHLEHFDERLDMWVADYDGYPFFDMNTVTGAKGFPKKAFLRAIDGDVFKFHGEDYSLPAIYAEVLKIERRLPKGRRVRRLTKHFSRSLNRVG